MKTHFWPIYLVLACFLASCTSMRQRNTYVTLDGDVVAPPKHGQERPTTTFTIFNETSVPEVWLVVLEDNNPLIRKTLWEVGNQTCYQVTVPKQEMVTIMICWFDERGNRMSKEWQKVTRQTLSSRPLELHITDFMLYGHAIEDCVVDNVTNQTVRISSNQGHRLLLEPGEFFIIPSIPSGVPITFWWESTTNPRNKPLQVTFTPNPEVIQFYQGKRCGSRLSITGY